jgi:hypothetical protein
MLNRADARGKDGLRHFACCPSFLLLMMLLVL